MKWLRWIALVICAFGISMADDAPSALPAVNKLRFLPLPGHEKDVLGAKVLGSNLSADDGFVELAEIKELPSGQPWGELSFPNTTPYRWIKYLAAPGTYGRIGKIEFYADEQKLKPFEVDSGYDANQWSKALDNNPANNHQSDRPDNQYVVVDLGAAATGPSPTFSPGQTESKDPVQVAIQSSLPSALIRYTLDGTVPTLENGQVYSSPLNVDKTTTIEASAFVDGHAPTPPVLATYIIGDPVQRRTFHVGNSLTGITEHFDVQARTAGAIHHSVRFLVGAGLTKTLWNAATQPIGDPADKEHYIDLYSTRLVPPFMYPVADLERAAKQWQEFLPGLAGIDDFTLQPRDFDIAEEADYDNRFLSAVQQAAPNVQPWLYIEWVERYRKRPTDLGTEPTSQMKKTWPALTWEESMAAMLLYGEDLKSKVDETYKGAKPLRIIPVALAMGWMHHMIEEGQVPGFAKDDFQPKLFLDYAHTNTNGAYLVDCMFYSAFYGESPQGKFLPVQTHLTSAQAQVMQKLAWDTFKNYPGSGLYEEGTTPVEKPQISSDTLPIKDVARVSLNSATPGAWFRYTLDGTTPTRTQGYVYCGVISARPGMTIKAIAYKSGSADSPVSEITFTGASGAALPP